MEMDWMSLINLIQNVSVFFPPTDVIDSVTIQQSPPKIVPTESRVNLSCSHEDREKNVMLWFQQPSSGLMNLIGTSYGNSLAMATEFKSRFELMRKDVLTGSMVLLNATVSDSAVYFCAASAQ